MSGSPIQKRIDITETPVSAATADRASGIRLLALQAFGASIQPPTALPLPRTLAPEIFWLRLQGSYDLAQKRLLRERKQGDSPETALEVGPEREPAAA